jgi:Competence protein CoiA-like family
MLVAYGPEGQPVVADEAPLEQLQRWSRERALYCPNCRGIVHVRGGHDKRMQLHFAHQRGECAWSTEAESVRHMRGKLVIAQWLGDQFPQARVTLEERLPGPNRIADIFVTHPGGRHQAVEYQCAPLDLEEWRHRHETYRAAGIIDTWVIGSNRREKQEAFLEAILAEQRELLFLDPLVSPPRAWLRWPISPATLRSWQQETTFRPLFEGWVGRLGYGATLAVRLHEVSLLADGHVQHPRRVALEERRHLLEGMLHAGQADEAQLRAYLRGVVDEDALREAILPLLRAYLRDPQLLRRYNFGRGRWNEPPREADEQRVQQARLWLKKLAPMGYSTGRLRELAKEIPRIGPYAAFAGYIEMLLLLQSD